jgi:hypothetical protein
MFKGFAPTGTRVAFEEIAIFRLARGKIVEKWGLVDRCGLFQQLGVSHGAEPRTEFLYEVTMEVDVHDFGLTPVGHRRLVLVKGG